MLKSLPPSIDIVEVGPRDGLQNEKTPIDTGQKFELIQGLIESGLKTIEVTSFVRPDRIPQMGDGKKLLAKVLKAYPDSRYNFPCLTPNLKGLKEALEAGAKEVAVFTAVSEQFNQKNINAGIEQSLKNIAEVMDLALKEKLKVRAYISCAFGCPYEGETSLEKLISVGRQCLDMGAYELSIGDTIGVGHPLQVARVCEGLLKSISAHQVAMHFHDTRGLALANIMASLEYGITTFDSSVAGLGGCPYAKGATGNVATNDLAYLFSRLGVETGVDQQKLAQISHKVLQWLGKESTSKALNALN